MYTATLKVSTVIPIELKCAKLFHRQKINSSCKPGNDSRIKSFFSVALNM